MQETSRPPAVGASSSDTTVAELQLPRPTRWLRPAVDAAARVNSSIHRKLLFGFLTGALLLVGMAALSLVVIAQMNERLDALNAQALKVSRAQQMLYDVTAQSHYRAKALLTHQDHPAGAASWNAKVDEKKGCQARERAGPGKRLPPHTAARLSRIAHLISSSAECSFRRPSAAERGR